MSSDFAVTGVHEMPLAVPAIPLTLSSSDSPVAVQIPPSAATWRGFRQWAVSDEFPERGKLTFVGGELIVDMSPESFEEQGAVKAEVSRVLLQLVRERKLGHYRIDRTLISHEAAGLSSEPDAVFLASATIKSGRVTFVPEIGRPHSSKEIVGTVDWVLEIISPSSRRKDAKLLREAYFAAGIPEYWLIDPTQEVDVDFQVLVRGPAAYVPVAANDGWLQSPTFGRSFRLQRTRDEDGFWEYTLHTQEKT